MPIDLHQPGQHGRRQVHVVEEKPVAGLHALFEGVHALPVQALAHGDLLEAVAAAATEHARGTLPDRRTGVGRTGSRQHEDRLPRAGLVTGQPAQLVQLLPRRRGGRRGAVAAVQGVEVEAERPCDEALHCREEQVRPECLEVKRD